MPNTDIAVSWPSVADTSTPGHPTDDASAWPKPRMRLMGAPMDIVSEARAVHDIVAVAEAGQGYWTITANLDHLRRYHRNPVERRLIDEADMVVADGMPLIWASRIAGEPLPERVAGSSMVWSICEIASTRGQSVFLLGGDPGVAERAAKVFQDRYPGLEIAGTACPSMGFEHDELELGRIQRQVAEAAPHIVFVALGFPEAGFLDPRSAQIAAPRVLPRGGHQSELRHRRRGTRAKLDLQPRPGVGLPPLPRTYTPAHAALSHRRPAVRHPPDGERHTPPRSPRLRYSLGMSSRGDHGAIA